MKDKSNLGWLLHRMGAEAKGAFWVLLALGLGLLVTGLCVGAATHNWGLAALLSAFGLFCGTMAFVHAIIGVLRNTAAA